MEQLYDTYARLYDAIYFKEEQYQKEINFLMEIKSKKNLNILDLCGGTGSHANILINHGHNVLIVDQSGPMIDVAKKKNPLIRTIQQDIFSFKTDEKFDLILCMYGAIHYTESINQIKELIKSFVNILNDGGKVVFDLRYSINLPENNQLDYNNGYWNRKFWKIKKGRDYSDIYVVTAFNQKEHFLDVHNLYHCDPFLFQSMFIESGFCKVDLYENYSILKPFDKGTKSDIAVLVASIR